jgi:hypothetical protein
MDSEAIPLTVILFAGLVEHTPLRKKVSLSGGQQQGGGGSVGQAQQQQAGGWTQHQQQQHQQVSSPLVHF